MTSSILAY